MIPVRRCLFTAVVMLGFTLPAGAAQASQSRHPHRVCLPVSASGVGQDLGGGHTEAIISSHGFVLGHTAATFTPTGVVDGVESFTGPIVLSFRGGTLTAQVNGTADTTGAFQARSESVTGTGLASRVTGHVKIIGNESTTTGAFTETITGALCLG